MVPTKQISESIVNPHNFASSERGESWNYLLSTPETEFVMEAPKRKRHSPLMVQVCRVIIVM